MWTLYFSNFNEVCWHRIFFHNTKLINRDILSNMWWYVATKKKKRCKRRHSVFNLMEYEECEVIAFRFDNRIAYCASLFPGRSARLNSAIFVKKKKKIVRNGTELAYISFHFARFHDKRNLRNLRLIKIRDVVVTERARMRNGDISF